VTPANSSRVVSRSVSRLAWSLANAFIGYRISAFIPVTPARRARSTWSRIGKRNASVLPDPVPVVIKVGNGRRSSPAEPVEASRANAAAWWTYGTNPGIQENPVVEPVETAAGRNGSRNRRNGPLNRPCSGSPRNSVSACRASSSASAKVVVR